jgi:predicted transcriptional regulator
MQCNAKYCTIEEGHPLFSKEPTVSKENVTFRLDTEKRAALDAIAAGFNRNLTYVLNEAISLYLDIHQWQIKEIQLGITEADAGDFASDSEVEALFARLTHTG